jgi:hypothetical protein
VRPWTPRSIYYFRDRDSGAGKERLRRSVIHKGAVDLGDRICGSIVLVQYWSGSGVEFGARS